MSEKTAKLKTKFLNETLPLAKFLFDEGKSQREILDIVNRHVKIRLKKFYKRQYPENLRVDYVQRVKEVQSKAEAIVFMVLEKNKIDFKPQYQIGPYKADFLIDDFIVLEIDGPHHGILDQAENDRIRDRYIQKMGYTIFRVPIWVFAVDEKAVIEEIKDLICQKSKG